MSNITSLHQIPEDPNASSIEPKTSLQLSIEAMIDSQKTMSIEVKNFREQLGLLRRELKKLETGYTNYRETLSKIDVSPIIKKSTKLASMMDAHITQKGTLKAA